ncbi:MAG: PAS domain S-box protein [Desulfobacterales bacterium]|nr:PAS domain S-box protein [Desulfobacterales bacterium]
MENRNLTYPIHYHQRGWLNYGRTRMVLFDLLQGFYQIQKVIKREVGGNASYLIFQAGIKGGLSFLEPMIQGGRIEAGPRGFADGLSRFTDGGFGDFQIREMDWEAGWARITCRSSVEGWIYARKRSRPRRPVCHYSRGIILGFMRATHRYAATSLENDLDCVETSCRATGHGHGVCEFIIGTQAELTSRGYETSEPRKSIQQQLKERVWEKTCQIQEANRFNERILKNAPVGILTLNSKGHVNSANPAMSRIIGVALRQLVGMSVVDQEAFFSPLLSEHLRRGLKGTRFELIDCPLISRGRGPRFVAVKGIPLKKSRGLVEGLLCIMEDTTEKTLSVQRVGYLKKYNENIIQSITDGIMVLDPSLKIQTWNRKMEEIFHIKAKNVLNKRFDKVAQTFSDPGLVNRLKAVIRSGAQIEEKGFRFESHSRGHILLNLKIVPLFDDQARVSGIIVLHEDITDKERSEIRYRNLFETAQDGICLTDLKGRVISANQKVLKVLETDWESLHGASLSRFLPPNRRSPLKKRLGLAIEGHEVEPYEVELASASGKLVPVELSITAVRKEDKVYGLHIIGRDITQRKKMEMQMVEASKMATIGEIASGVAHEINNPLASVAGYAEEMLDIIHENGSLGAKELNEFKEGLATILEQTQRCKELTQNLLNFARQGEFEVIPTRLNDLIEKTLFLFEPDIRMGKTKIVKTLEPKLPAAETSPAHLQQVFINILKNALDAVAHVRKRGVVRVISRSENGLIRVQVQDNGKGIPKKHVKKIFDPFFTTKPPGRGTGLGLSICHGIMKKLKGSIDVDSRVGLGTTFTVSIPLKWHDMDEARTLIQ